MREKDELIQELQRQVDSNEEDRDHQKQSSSAMQMVNQDLKNQLAAAKKKCDHLEAQLAASSAEEIDTLNELAEALTLENETLKLKRDQDQHMLEKQNAEIKQLREEKELAELELEEAILTAGSVYETTDQDPTANNQELILANGKLRQALQMLNDKSERQQAEFQLEIAQYQQKLHSLPDLLEKQKLCAKFEKDLAAKNEVIAELSTRIDEQASLSDMVEKLAEQMLKRDDDIVNLKKQIKEMNELKKLDQELVTDLEELNATQEKSISNLEFDIYTLKNNIRTLQTEIKDKEDFINRLRAKISTLNTELDQLKDTQQVDLS